LTEEVYDDNEEWAVTHKEMAGNFLEGGELGVCEIHGCDIIGSKRPVMSYPKDNNGKVIGEPYPYLVRVCPMCHAEGIKNKTVKAVKDYVSEFRTKKHIDLNKDVIVKYDFSDELSVVKVDAMVDWIVKKVGTQKKVKYLNVRKHVELAKNRASGEEARNKYMKQVHEIEQADLLIFDSLADFAIKDAEKALNVLFSVKDDCSIMILTIPESDDRLGELPVRLKFRFENAQVMQMSSTGKER
jgi:hypothetical protein